MITEKKRIGELHAEHQQWLGDAAFYADEIKFFKERLNEVAGKNTGAESAKQVEHFQNQFIIHKEQLDILNHEAREHERLLANFAKDHPVAIDHRLFDNHSAFIDKAATFKKLYIELRKDFSHFLSAIM